MTTVIRKIPTFFLLMLICFSLQAQDTKNTADIEKIYLHTDNNRYFVGENIFYKAYKVGQVSNLLDDKSAVLYVELIASDARIIARNKTYMKTGLGDGDFNLADSLGVKPGRYQLRAYTNWNRNFGNDFVFKKDIDIIDVFEQSPKATKTKESDIKKTVAIFVKPKTITIDFFPEGGSLIEGVSSIVGFKAVDENGNPKEIQGELFDSDNELITSFTTTHDGMGKLQLIPMEGKNYYVKIATEFGTLTRKDFPKVAQQGYSLSFKDFKGKYLITINTNPATLAQNPNAVLKLECKSKGISYLETSPTLSEISYSFVLPKDKIPDGISQITLYDAAMKPHSERLIFIEKENDLEVQLSTDKISYLPNEKAIINVTSKSKTGEAKAASYSLSATDMNGQSVDADFGTNISSYFLIEADIRGTINNPGYYFNAQNPKRLEHLDNLLLTQGWRDFVWKTTPKPSDNTNYAIEKGFTISGRVKQLFSQKAKINNKIGLVLINKKHINTYKTVTDSIGNFKFENRLFSGKTNMFLNSKDQAGKYNGEIVLNPMEQPSIVTEPNPNPIVWSEATKTAVEKVFSKYVAFGVNPENVLNEVSISSKKKNTKTFSIGIPETTYTADADTPKYIDIFDLLVSKTTGMVPFEDSVKFTRYEVAPLFLLNGFTVFKEELSAIRLEDIVKIETVKGTSGAMFYGQEGANGIVSIYTKPSNKMKNESFHSIKREVEGFYTARVFYSPNPEVPNPALDNNQSSVRNTLYWNPYVHPDKTGTISLNYFNTKVETQIKVALEGITTSGIPVVKNVFYTIKK